MSLRLTKENNSINLNNEMKKFFTLLLLLSGILFFTACDKDEPIEYEYRMVVTCDTPDQDFIVQMAHRADFTTKTDLNLPTEPPTTPLGHHLLRKSKGGDHRSALSQWQTLQNRVWNIRGSLLYRESVERQKHQALHL